MSVVSIDTAKLLELINDLKANLQEFDSSSPQRSYSFDKMSGKVPSELQAIGEAIRKNRELMLELYRQTISYLESIYLETVESDQRTARTINMK